MYEEVKIWCEECDGKGYIGYEGPLTYHEGICSACDGKGHVTRKMIRNIFEGIEDSLLEEAANALNSELGRLEAEELEDKWAIRLANDIYQNTFNMYHINAGGPCPCCGISEGGSCKCNIPIAKRIRYLEEVELIARALSDRCYNIACNDEETDCYWDKLLELFKNEDRR